MDIVLDHVNALRDSLQAIAELIDEGTFKFNSSGMEFVAADRAVVAVAALSLSKDLFKKYTLSEDVSIGLNLEEFLSVLKRVKADESLSFEINKGQLVMTSVGKYRRTFTLPILSIPEEETPPIDKLTDFKASFEISTDILQDAIADASLFADSMTFIVKKDVLMIRASVDSKSTEMVLEPGDEGLKNFEVEEDVKSNYSLDYLKKMMKASKISNTVRISLSTNYPMKMNFSAPGVKLGFILAPRFEEE